MFSWWVIEQDISKTGTAASGVYISLRKTRNLFRFSLNCTKMINYLCVTYARWLWPVPFSSFKAKGCRLAQQVIAVIARKRSWWVDCKPFSWYVAILQLVKCETIDHCLRHTWILCTDKSESLIWVASQTKHQQWRRAFRLDTFGRKYSKTFQCGVLRQMGIDSFIQTSACWTLIFILFCTLVDFILYFWFT